MREWRINLDGQSESDRARFLAAFLGRLIDELVRQFPPTSGYQHFAQGLEAVEESLVWSEGVASWTISRGRYCGLELIVTPEAQELRSIRITLDAFVPVVKKLKSRVDRILERIEGMRRRVPILLDHLLIGVFTPVIVVLLPFIFFYRIARLWFWPQIVLVSDQVESVWSALQGSCPGEITLSRLTPRPLVYSIVLLVAAGAMKVCFWLAGLPGTVGNWKVALYVLGGILCLISVVLLIALVLTLLGFEARLTARRK